ncbi:uncharacterized protein BDZ83DRAFT_189080 [Colletotrichum acutatum]|uniref:Uncharacterized protein n=1 Tax=Glomerella acutata TaxID=27357 RepID=A0AAD8XH53_GLOAC|nr:uncharacterized protein BDZ83DRAFT_189080 [Colletotrichum acutatum]KAK1727784.1 hypothetical protein BDZ83DRAFT_189080 [Colletotrichum acutatum]
MVRSFATFFFHPIPCVIQTQGPCRTKSTSSTTVPSQLGLHKLRQTCIKKSRLYCKFVMESLLHQTCCSHLDISFVQSLGLASQSRLAYRVPLIRETREICKHQHGAPNRCLASVFWNMQPSLWLGY